MHRVKHQVKHIVKTTIEKSQNHNPNLVKKSKLDKEEQLHKVPKPWQTTKGNRKAKATTKSVTQKHSQIESPNRKLKPIQNPQMKLQNQTAYTIESDSPSKPTIENHR